jgi:hypothetical protein
VYFAHFVVLATFVSSRDVESLMAASYPPPVDQLLTLGEPSGDDWLDYRALGTTEEHVPTLVEVLQDESLSWNTWEKGIDERPLWAPLHAVRALGQLRAEAAVEPLIQLLFREHDDDVLLENIPTALAMIGRAALGPIRDALPGAADVDDGWVAVSLADALKQMPGQHPELRGEAVEAITGQLNAWRTQNHDVNAFLISNLMDLHAVEAAPVIQAMFEGGRVDDTITGDWEDVQVALGLLEKRTTPRPRYTPVGFDQEMSTQYAPPPRAARPAPIPGSDSAAARSRSLRKTQKKKAKGKRR